VFGAFDEPFANRFGAGKVEADDLGDHIDAIFGATW